MPYSSEFFIAVEESSDSFKIIEIYNVLKLSITSDFGYWTKGHVSFRNLEIYQRRNSFKGVKLKYCENKGSVRIVTNLKR